MSKSPPSDFKVHPCALAENHCTWACPFYHGRKDRRRDPDEFAYIPVMCRNAYSDCDAGDTCPYAHSCNELNYHPTQLRTRLCPNNFPQTCSNPACYYAHSLEELNDISFMRFKNSSERTNDRDTRILNGKLKWASISAARIAIFL